MNLKIIFNKNLILKHQIMSVIVIVFEIKVNFTFFISKTNETKAAISSR